MSEVDNSKMTKGERAELAQLCRKRERVQKTAVEEHAKKLLADFEQQIATTYHLNDDAIWKAAYENAEEEVAKAARIIKGRIKELGIPPEFAPSLQLGWYGRGQNASRERCAELRRVAQSSLAAGVAKAKTLIERQSLEAQTEIVANGIQSHAARAFLENLAPVENLIPQLDIKEVQKLITHKVDEDGDS